MAQARRLIARPGIDLDPQSADVILRDLFDHADLLDPLSPDGYRYLLVAIPPSLLEQLSVYGADAEDDEPCGDEEPEDQSWWEQVPDWDTRTFPPSESTRQAKRQKGR